MPDTDQKTGLVPHLTPLTAWALALGTSIGWGSLVVTSRSYLSQAGPLGSVLGLLIGALIMLMIARNYAYLARRWPSAGGLYTYTKEVFGYDRAFLVSWFLALTYLAMLWANATALPLFARYFLGELFRWGKLYTVFGYEVYAGEALLTAAAIVLVALFCSNCRRAVAAAMTGLCLLLAAGIALCFGAAMLRSGGTDAMAPAFLPDKNALAQILGIACISPWAFVGFENISHAAEESAFPLKKLFRVLAAAVIAAAALYVFVLLLSVAAHPPEYASWLDYIRDLDHLDGVKALPAFYAAWHFMGPAGVGVLMAVLLALILTSLIGNTLALSRLLFAAARDDVLPRRFAALNEKHIPGRAIWLAALLSLPIPLLGRTAIGWIVDVTTIGATLLYCFASAAALKRARQEGDKLEQWTGGAALVLMIAVGCYLLIPDLFASGVVEKESLFLFVVWSVLGFLFFRGILRRDASERFGRSLIVWIALLSLVLFVAMVWMSQTMRETTDKTMETIRQYYADTAALPGDRAADAAFVHDQIEQLERSDAVTLLTVAGLFVFSLVTMMSNYSYMRQRHRRSEEELEKERASARVDAMTGVKNKLAYAEKETELDDAIGRSAATPFAVAVCDVNGLKHVNDTMGHKAGDAYIRQASELVCEHFRHSPVYRIGGDEFVAVLEGADYEDRGGVLQRLNEAVEQNIGTDRVVVSAGMSEFLPEEDMNFHTVFQRADERMYRRKQELKSMGAVTRE